MVELLPGVGIGLVKGIALTFSNILAVFGTIGLIIYTFPWLGFIFIPLAVYYVGVPTKNGTN